MMENTHPQEDVLGGVKASGVDAGCIGCAAFAHDTTGVAGDCALGRLASATTLACRTTTLTAATACCVRHHKVNHAFCGPANLGREQLKKYLFTSEYNNV